MNYEYSGYLSTILYKPDSDVRDSLPCIEFSGDDLDLWRTQDLEYSLEWRDIPARRKRTKDGIQIEGDFRNQNRIDSLSENDPRYWAPLSTIGLQKSGFPVDVTQYPIIEVTYRCTSPSAHPTWMWTYDGGSHFGALPKSTEWITVARNVQHFGFPERVNDVILRLYSPTRTVESFEIKAVRFRAMSPSETEALDKSHAQIEELKPKKRYPILDSFMPLGVYMDARSAERLAAMLGVGTMDYWEMVMQDLAVNYHNAISLSNIDRMPVSDRDELLRLAERHDVKIVARHDFPVGGPPEEQKRVIETHVRPTADSPAILARMTSGEPIENNFQEVLNAKRMIEEGDPNHPVAIVARYPNAYPLFAPFYQASGVGHFSSRRPWDMGAMVRAHVPLSDAQQFWIAAPAFTYPTETPEWSTCPEMRLMFNLGIANGARGWFAYSYHNDPVWLRGRLVRTLTGPFLTFSDLWLELGQRMKLGHALAPLLLKARRTDDLEEWFTSSIEGESKDEIQPGIPPMSIHHLRGENFSLYMNVSNNVRDMHGVNIAFPKDAAPGQEIHDLTEYVRTGNWGSMARVTHSEMFPGQGQVFLVAPKEDCEMWRDEIAARLIATDAARLRVNLKIAQAYSLPCLAMEKQLDAVGDASTLNELKSIHGANDELTDLIYRSPQIYTARSRLIAANSALCGCDGALCRLMSRGKIDRARELGEEVIPLAQQLTTLRLQLRRGEGETIASHCTELVDKAVSLLAEIRSHY